MKNQRSCSLARWVSLAAVLGVVFLVSPRPADATTPFSISTYDTIGVQFGTTNSNALGSPLAGASASHIMHIFNGTGLLGIDTLLFIFPPGWDASGADTLFVDTLTSNFTNFAGQSNGVLSVLDGSGLGVQDTLVMDYSGNTFVGAGDFVDMVIGFTGIRNDTTLFPQDSLALTTVGGFTGYKDSIIVQGSDTSNNPPLDIDFIGVLLEAGPPTALTMLGGTDSLTTNNRAGAPVQFVNAGTPGEFKVALVDAFGNIQASDSSTNIILEAVDKIKEGDLLGALESLGVPDSVITFIENLQTAFANFKKFWDTNGEGITDAFDGILATSATL